MSLTNAVLKVNSNVIDVKAKIREAALTLREEITKAEHNALRENVKIEDIQKGEVQVPELLTYFFQNLVAGPETGRWKSERKMLRMESIAEDIIFSATCELKKPKKHLVLGMALKSLTGSRKVIEVSNKLGHCASYHTVQELETEMTFEANKQGNVTPHGIVPDLSVGTGAAWDNFDQFMDTLTGKDTLHDTVGIAYQAVPDHAQAVIDSSGQSQVVQEQPLTTTNPKKKRRRTYEPSGLILLPTGKSQN